jgi:hypothetical protein
MNVLRALLAPVKRHAPLFWTLILKYYVKQIYKYFKMPL